MVGRPVPSDPAHAFLYNSSGSLIDLRTLGGQSSFAYSINQSGQIAGQAQTASGTWHGVIWTITGSAIDLGAGFAPLAINNEGLVGGKSNQTLQPALYNLSSGSATDPPTLGGAQGQVEAMNDDGLVVGFSDTPTSSHGFLYDINTGALTDLGNLASPAWGSDALGVNDLGQVVGGYSLDGTGAAGAAFIYTQADGMQNLNDLIDSSSGWYLETACAINNLGEIVGEGFNPQGNNDAFLLTPISEPPPLQLTIVLGTILTGGFACKRHRILAAVTRAAHLPVLAAFCLFRTRNCGT